MGMIPCEVCGECIMGAPKEILSKHLQCHLSCEPAYYVIQRLKHQLDEEEKRCDRIQDAVLRILAEYPQNYKDNVYQVEEKMMLELWNAAQLRFHEDKTLKDFLETWLADHAPLIGILHLFDRKNKQSFKEKLKWLREKYLEYRNYHEYDKDGNEMLYTVEEIIQQAKNS